jgi:hypothetical protein
MSVCADTVTNIQASRQKHELPFLELEQRLTAKSVELRLRPPAWIVEHEARSLSVQLFLFEQLGDAHRLDWPASGVCKEKVEAYSLQGRHAKLVTNVHETLHVVPGDCALHAAARSI